MLTAISSGLANTTLADVYYTNPGDTDRSFVCYLHNSWSLFRMTS